MDFDQLSFGENWLRKISENSYYNYHILLNLSESNPNIRKRILDCNRNKVEQATVF